MKRFKFATIQPIRNGCYVFFSDDLDQMAYSRHSNRVKCDNRDLALILAAQHVLPVRGRINERVGKGVYNIILGLNR